MKYFKNSSTTSTKCSSCYAIRFCMFTAKMRASCNGPFADKAGQLRFLKDSIQEKGDNHGGSYYHTVQVRRYC